MKGFEWCVCNRKEFLPIILWEKMDYMSWESSSLGQMAVGVGNHSSVIHVIAPWFRTLLHLLSTKLVVCYNRPALWKKYTNRMTVIAIIQVVIQWQSKPIWCNMCPAESLGNDILIRLFKSKYYTTEANNTDYHCCSTNNSYRRLHGNKWINKYNLKNNKQT